jgi:hypothetical protein
VRIAYVLRKEDLALAVRAFAAGLEAYRKARGLDELPDPALVAARRPDFFTPAV